MLALDLFVPSFNPTALQVIKAALIIIDCFSKVTYLGLVLSFFSQTSTSKIQVASKHELTFRLLITHRQSSSASSTFIKLITNYNSSIRPLLEIVTWSSLHKLKTLSGL